MTRRSGQASPGGGGGVLRRLCAGLLALLVVALLGSAALVLRLGEESLPLPPLARTLERAASAQLDGGAAVEIGEAAIAWGGWRGGAAAPLNIRLSGIKLRNAAGDLRGELPEAAATLSIPALLRGTLALATVELRRPRLTVVRTAEGGFDLALGPSPPPAAAETAPPSPPQAPDVLPEALDVLRTLARPPSESGTLAALRRVRVSGGEIVVVDLALGRSWSLLDARIDMRRAETGGLMAEGAATVGSDGFSAPVRLHGSASGQPMHITLGLSLPALRPAQLAAVWPGLGPLSALDALVSLSAVADLDAWARPERIEVKASAHAGRLRLGRGHHMPFAALSASAVAEGPGAPIRLTGARLALPPGDAAGQGGAVLTGSGEAALRGGAWEAALDLRTETLPAAALDRAWPEGFEPELRRAVLGAMPSGTLEGGRLALRLRAPETLGEVELVEARAGLQARDAVFALGRGGRVAVASASVSASFRPDGLRLEQLSVRLPGVGGAPAGPTLTARGGAERRGPGGGWLARAELSVDAVRFADLGSHWPENLAPNARRWLVQNVTAGEARNGAWRVEAELPEALDAVRVLTLSGRAEAAGATVHWLRPIPPVQGVSAVADFALDSVTISGRGGRQARADNGGRGAIEVREATVRIAGLDGETASADIALQLSGPLAEAVAVIKHPRLKLFERKPLELEVAGGQADARLRIAFPLLADLPVERLRIDTTARIADAQLRRVLLNHDVENGRFELSADTQGMKLNGEATLVGAPVRLNLELDFRPGPPTQVQERATLAAARADPRQIAMFGLDTGGLLEGPTAVEARYERRRNGSGAVALRGDLRDARLVFNPANWEKPPGAPGAAEAVLRLQGDALLSADNMRLEAPGLSLQGGRASFSAGGKRLEQVEVAEGRFGLSRFAGAVQRPLGDGTAEGEAWRAALRGPLLDLRPFLSSGPAAPRGRRTADADDRSLPITLDLRFDRALAGETGEFTGVQAGAWFDAAGLLRAARATGRTAAAPANGNGGAFDLSLSPEGAAGRRALRVSAEDGGAFLRAVDVNSIRGGRLSVNAAFEETRPGAALSGTAELDDFVLRDAPAAAKVLQAMTLYGLVEALGGGKGVVFARLVAPFALTPEALTLRDARAFSASLGVTAKGRIGRERRTVEVEGTIVPAYFFNSLLGRVPLLGRLFSPEAGGGLFAATYRVQGPLDDPSITVNPLAALTPGFLRGLFGIFEQGRGEGERR